ncbi:MAG: DUF485 domain-containing protein [Zoogloea sp.]|nr:DUF485 domain-containing protein [Zoogloea sp.]
MRRVGQLNWKAIEADPRFRRLQARKATYRLGLVAFAICCYFLLPFGAAYFKPLFAIRVWGPINLGLLFVLVEFAVALGVARAYVRRAAREFDLMARDLIRDAERAGC